MQVTLVEHVHRPQKFRTKALLITPNSATSLECKVPHKMLAMGLAHTTPPSVRMPRSVQSQLSDDFGFLLWHALAMH